MGTITTRGDDTRSVFSLAESASIVFATAPVGYLLGHLGTVHLVGDETTAVWLTTIAVAGLGLAVSAVRHS